MHRALALKLLLLSSGLASALLGQTFERSYGGPAQEFARGVVEIPESGFLIAGHIESLPGLAGLFLVRTDCRGDTLWTRVVADSGVDRMVFSATGDGTGGIVAVGRARLQRADWDAWAIQVDSSGNTEWNQTWGVSGWDDCALGVCRTPDAGWAVCGYTLQARQPDVNVVRFSPEGRLLWSVVNGTARADYAWAIAATPDGSLLVAGTTVPEGSRYTDIYLFRLDSLGYLGWSRTVGDSLWDEARALAVMPDNGFAIAGFSSSYSLGMDCLVVRFDSSGQAMWQITLGRPGQSERGHGLALTSGDALVVVGESEPVVGEGADAYMAGIHPEGVVVWERFYGGSGYDCVTAVVSLDDGELAVVGETEVGNSKGVDFYFIRTDPTGGVGIELREPAGGRLTAPASLGDYKAVAPGCTRVIGSDGRVVRTLDRSETRWDGLEDSGRSSGMGVFYMVTAGGHVRKVLKLN